MPEGIVSIGATFDKTNVDAGLGATQEMVTASMQAITTAVTETGAKTKAAWKGISDDVKVAAESVSADSLKVAETSRAVAAAQADVRRAITLTKDASIPAAQSMAVLAAAQQKLALESFAASAASKLQAQGVVVAAEEAAASAAPVAASWAAAGAEIKAALTGVQEKLVATGETANLTTSGMVAGFAGIGSLLGAGILVAFGAHFLDETSKMIIELGILSEKTGISVHALAGLREIARESGEDFSPMETGLTRMLRAMGTIEQGSKPMLKAFADLGIQAAELPALMNKPEEMLYRIARGMAETHDQGIRVASSITIFGRGGAALVPILEKQGEAMQANVSAAAQLTGVTDEARESALRWTQETARLSTQFQSVMIPVLEHLGDVLDALGGIAESIAIIIMNAFQIVAYSAALAIEPVARLGFLMKDIALLDWKSFASDAKAAVVDWINIWKKGIDDIQKTWQDVPSHFHWAKSGEIPPVNLQDATQAAKNAPGEENATSGSGKSTTAASTQPAVAEEKTLASLMEEMNIKARNDALKTVQLINQVYADANKQRIAEARNAAEEEIRLSHERFEDFVKECDFKVRMGQMSETQRIAAIKAAAEQEKRVYLELSAEIQRLDRGNVTALEADLRKQQQAMHEFNQRMMQSSREAALKFKQDWDKVTNSFNKDFIRAMNETITHTKTVSQAFAQMFNQIILGLVDMVAKWLLKEAEKWAMAKILQVSGLASQHAIDASSNLAKVTADAGVAAAGAMAYYTAIDPPVAPAMAGLAFAETMAYGSAAPYDTGGMLQPGRVGANLSGYPERVLSPSQTANFEKMVNQSSSSSSVVHNHNSITQNLHGYDRAGMKSALRDHADTLLEIVQGGIFSGRLRPA